jgi:hypothetical protein
VQQSAKKVRGQKKAGPWRVACGAAVRGVAEAGGGGGGGDGGDGRGG